nr:uncharacterized protein LOC124816512 [Hydra vulgaris]
MDLFSIKWLLFCRVFLCVRSFITRLPCISYASFDIIYNKYYYGTIYSTSYATNVNDCGILCVRNPKCIFANFKLSEMKCELMSTNGVSSNSKSDLLWQVLLSDITSITNIGPICETNTPCGSNNCRDICLTVNETLVHNYTCFDTVDLTSGGMATSSSISFGDPGYAAASAVDGNLNSFMTTDCDLLNLSWFRLELQNIYWLNRIDVYNRRDCCPDRIVGSKLFVSITDKSNDFYEIGTLTSDIKQMFTVSNFAKFVIINKDSGCLQLAEIFVFI